MFKPRIQPTAIEFQEYRTPYSPLFDDVYFAAEKGIEESNYVYLEGSGFTEAFKNQQKLIIGEIGFGVGLNFLLTLKHFLENSSEDQTLTYFSVEKHPVFLEDLRTLYGRYPELTAVANLLLAQYPVLVPGFHTLTFANHRVKLILMLGDAHEMYSRLDPQDERIEFWYLDGFAPKKNPDAFSETLFHHLARVSASGAQGASFTAAGWVRRSLESAGFKIEKRDGFGFKRECIRVTLEKNYESPSLPAWFSGQNLKKLKKGELVAVIGGGLSGTAIARSLARRGFSVTILEQETIAAHASGNSIGLFNVQMSRLPNPISRFSQLSLTHFLREVKELGAPHLRGIQRLDAIQEKEAYEQALKTSEYPPSFFLHEEEGSIFFPECGVLNPKKLCEKRARNPHIRIVKGTVAEVRKEGNHFELLSPAGEMLAHAEHVIYATGSAQVKDGVLNHTTLNTIPMRPIRGQLVHVKPTAESKFISHSLVDSGYITPVVPEISGSETHAIGATYQAKEIAENQEELDTVALLKEARNRHRAFESIDQDHVQSIRVGYRLSTPDKLPVIGPLTRMDVLKKLYQKTLRGSLDEATEPLIAEPGEWVLMGMGSRGITFSSYGAEILASLMCGEALPVETDLWEHLHAARFFVRKLKKPEETSAKLR